MKKSVVFLAPANGSKPSIVITKLLRNDFFLQNYECKFVVDNHSGKLIDLLINNKVEYIIMN